MSQHCRLASHRTQAFFQYLGDFALPVRQVLLAVEDAQNDIAQARQGDAIGARQPRPFAAAKVNQVEPGSTSIDRATSPSRVLVDM